MIFCCLGLVTTVLVRTPAPAGVYAVVVVLPPASVSASGLPSVSYVVLAVRCQPVGGRSSPVTAAG